VPLKSRPGEFVEKKVFADFGEAWGGRERAGALYLQEKVDKASLLGKRRVGKRTGNKKRNQLGV